MREGMHGKMITVKYCMIKKHLDIILAKLVKSSANGAQSFG